VEVSSQKVVQGALEELVEVVGAALLSGIQDTLLSVDKQDHQQQRQKLLGRPTNT